MSKRPKIVVVGYGVAGAAIVHKLANKYDVTVLSRGFEESSTASNQKWKHSGLLYHSQRLAEQIWEAHQNMDSVLEKPFIMKRQARFIALELETLQERINKWCRWGIKDWGIKIDPLAAFEFEYAGVLGKTNAVGGFATPDCVMDFPELVRNLRYAAIKSGVTFIESASANKLIIEGKEVRGINYTNGNSSETISCDFCILSLGAWTGQLLEKHEIKLPLILKKCIVLKYPGELVPCLTVCLDIRDGKSPDAALAPFKGETIAAESMGIEVENPNDRSFDQLRVQELKREYERCFPSLSSYEPSIGVCFKIEQKSAGGAPNVEYHVYSEENIGLSKIAVAIPGKASLMFQLATNVAAILKKAVAK